MLILEVKSLAKEKKKKGQLIWRSWLSELLTLSFLVDLQVVMVVEPSMEVGLVTEVVDSEVDSEVEAEAVKVGVSAVKQHPALHEQATTSQMQRGNGYGDATLTLV